MTTIPYSTELYAEYFTNGFQQVVDSIFVLHIKTILYSLTFKTTIRIRSVGAGYETHDEFIKKCFIECKIPMGCHHPNQVRLNVV